MDSMPLPEAAGLALDGMSVDCVVHRATVHDEFTVRLVEYDASNPGHAFVDAVLRVAADTVEWAQSHAAIKGALAHLARSPR